MLLAGTMAASGPVPQERSTVPTEHGTCPSVSGHVAESVIIGFVGADGRVAPIPTAIPLTPDMREAIGDRPERVFRLAAPCTASACAQWNSAGCGLVGSLLTSLAGRSPDAVTRCAIRADCVWFRDAGLEACRICPAVTYNPAE